MNKYRNSNAANSTKTYNKLEIENPTDNIYEAISIIAKRSAQINSEIKKELHDKLDEFATHNDSLEEVFENKEQIEVSKFYEKLPKPYAIAIDEWLENKIFLGILKLKLSNKLQYNECFSSKKYTSRSFRWNSCL